MYSHFGLASAPLAALRQLAAQRRRAGRFGADHQVRPGPKRLLAALNQPPLSRRSQLTVNWMQFGIWRQEQLILARGFRQHERGDLRARRPCARWVLH
jgi:hypothetical protein